MDKVYVLMPQNFEYNDEIERAEGYGRPTKAYLSEDEAKAESHKLNCQFFRGRDLLDFAYEYREITVGQLGRDDAVSRIEAVLGERWPAEGRWGRRHLPADLTEEEWAKLSEIVTVRGYLTVEVPKG